MSVIDQLEEARRREKEQTLFYRALAAAAEDAGDVAGAERLNELHADEQHHLSRLTARLLEFGATPTDFRDLSRPEIPALDTWQATARDREGAEIAFYEELLGVADLDADTRDVLAEILASERHHREHLAGKWMSA